MNCFKCQTEIVELPNYELRYNNCVWNFCSRLCLVEYIAPELKNVCAPKQWIPTDEEIERMSQ